MILIQIPLSNQNFLFRVSTEVDIEYIDVNSDCQGFFKGILEISNTMISSQVTSQSVKHIIIGDKSYLKESGSLSIQNCTQLEDIRFGDGCYCAKYKVQISDCPTLHIIIIGSNCFQSQDSNASLIIGKNRKLRDIHIGNHTFEFFNSITINGLAHY